MSPPRIRFRTLAKFSGCPGAWIITHRVDEAREFARRGCGEHPRRGALLPDAAVVDENDRVGGAPGEAHLMSDEDHRHAAGGERLQNPDHFADQFRIERRGDFVKQNEARRLEPKRTKCLPVKSRYGVATG